MEHNDLKHYGYLFKCNKIMQFGYHRFYHKELNEYKNKNMGIIEIGIDQFKSIDMWKQYFPKAFIYGIDIHIQYEDPRIKIYKADQNNIFQLETIRQDIKHPIYVIIDDGSHLPSHQLNSFDYLFSNVLEEGGTYIIETIEVSYWKRGETYHNATNYGYLHPESIVEKFKLVLDYVNSFTFHDLKLLNENTNFLSQKTKDQILSITFAQNCIIIKKKQFDDINYIQTPYSNIEYVK